jgi:hypothetical protein
MGDPGESPVFPEFEQSAPVDLEEFPYPPQAIDDLAVDLIKGDGQEPRG